MSTAEDIKQQWQAIESTLSNLGVALRDLPRDDLQAVVWKTTPPDAVGEQSPSRENRFIAPIALMKGDLALQVTDAISDVWQERNKNHRYVVRYPGFVRAPMHVIELIQTLNQQKDEFEALVKNAFPIGEDGVNSRKVRSKRVGDLLPSFMDRRKLQRQIIVLDQPIKSVHPYWYGNPKSVEPLANDSSAASILRLKQVILNDREGQLAIRNEDDKANYEIRERTLAEATNYLNNGYRIVRYHELNSASLQLTVDFLDGKRKNWVFSQPAFVKPDVMSVNDFSTMFAGIKLDSFKVQERKVRKDRLEPVELESSGIWAIKQTD